MADCEHSADEPSQGEVIAASEDSRVRRLASPSLIGYTVVMKGELIVGEDLVIEGTFDGTITGDGRNSITVRRVARISGAVSAGNVNVEDGTDLHQTVLSGRIRLAGKQIR